VYLVPGKKKPYVAQISKDRRLISLGYHLTAEAAARAYDDAAKKLHGEFATLNFNEDSP
jgi:hypothetical protein